MAVVSPMQRMSLAQDLRQLWSHLSRRRRLQLLLLAGLLLASSTAETLSLGAAVPFLAVLSQPQRIWGSAKVQWIAEILDWHEPGQLIWPACLAFAGTALLAGVVRLLALRSSIGLAGSIGSDLSIEVFRRTLYQPYAVHLQRNSSNTISAVALEVDQVVFILNTLLQLATAGLVSIGLLGLLLAINPGMTLTLLVLLSGGYGLMVLLSRGPLARLGHSIVADQAQLICSLQEGLGAIRDVILDGSQPAYTSAYGTADRRLRRHRGFSQFLALAPRYGMESISLMAIAFIALFLSGGAAGFLGALPILGGLALGAQRLLPLVQMIYGGWTGLRVNQPALHSVLAYLQQPIAAADLAPSPPPLAFSKTIELRQVSFRYGPHLPWVLRDLNLTIRRGDCLGIVGETGSGKSTLVDLLMGLLEPSEGALLVDGIPVHGEQLRRWRSGVAHVPQRIFLSDASIAENIAFGEAPDCIDLNRMKRSAEQAQIMGFIDTLANGFETQVGERGVRLSGGQGQRIGIARALYRMVNILVLDEATSALDRQTEAAVMRSVRDLSLGTTVIIVAHRKESLKYCDSIVPVEKLNSAA